MRDRRLLLAITMAVATVTTLSLSACVPAEAPDVGAAQREANDFLEDAVDQDGVLATTSGTIGPRAENAPGDQGTTVDFSEAVDLDGVDVVCFGGGKAQLTVTVLSAPGGTDSVTMPLTCDGQRSEATLPQRLRGVTQVSVNGWLEQGELSVLAAVFRGTAP